MRAEPAKPFARRARKIHKKGRTAEAVRHNTVLLRKTAVQRTVEEKRLRTAVHSGRLLFLLSLIVMGGDAPAGASRVTAEREHKVSCPRSRPE